VSKPTVGSLFAGIGGFDLGFERAGWDVKWQVEIDPYCQRVLAKHWPDVRRHNDVKTFPPGDADDWRVDCIIGGFPCQDISNAGKRIGIDGERSGLWSEYARIVGLLRPGFIVVENVAALLDRGIDRVLGDLAESGYDAEWDCLPAAVFGAPFVRDRVFLVAYPHGERGGARREGRFAGAVQGLCVPRQSRIPFDEADRIACAGHWSTEPGLVRLVCGISPALDRLRGLGNAVVPQVAQWIGERLMRVINGDGRRDQGTEAAEHGEGAAGPGPA
jgi:DNA (cytosine-5)-methyltransferase 1